MTRKMDVERIKVLNEHLAILAQLVDKNVSVYREINKTNQAVQNEIFAYAQGKFVDLEHHAGHSPSIRWDVVEALPYVGESKHSVWDVLQSLRTYKSVEKTAQELNLSEVEVSNTLCYAAYVCVDGNY